MRRPVIAGNWKMYKTRAEAVALVRELADLVGNTTDVDIIVCPPLTALAAVGGVLEGTKIGLGAQNVHWEDQGAFTGEVSVAMLVDCGCRYVLIGHSERREHFLESNDMLNRKLKKVLSTTGLIPVFCVGERVEEREAGRVQEVVSNQLDGGLSDLTPSLVSRIIIAYEPVWAIGTGKTATPEIAEEVHRMIRSWWGDRYSTELSNQIRILYGGSVKPENIAELMVQEDIDGALVGGASLDAQTFAKIVKYKG